MDPKVLAALAGNYEIDVANAIKEGWQKTTDSRAAILQGLGIVFVIAFMAFHLLGYTAVTPEEAESTSFTSRLLTDVAITILIAPFAAALVMMGVDSSVNRRISVADLFKFISRTLVLTVAALLTTAIVQIGLLFFIIPGLYLIAATGFTVPLILDKRLLPMQAIGVSIRVVNHKWLEFVKLYLLFFALLMLVIFTFGIAIIWVAPFYYNVKGVLYRDIFGVKGVEPQEPIEESPVSDTFEA